jgi:hypothetical protein
MADHQGSKKTDYFVLPGLLITSIIVIAAGLQPIDLNSDDAYITYHYSMNMSSGSGLVYNQGERVYGCSTPFYALLLSGLGWLGLPIFKAARLVAVISALGLLVSGMRLGDKVFGDSGAGLLAGLFVLSYPPVAALAFSGMETMLFLFLLTLGFAFLEDRPYLALAVFGMALGVRIESAAALLVAASYHALRSGGMKRILPFAFAGLFLLVYALAGYLYYDSFVPVSMTRKMQVGSSWGGAFKILKQFVYMGVGFCPGWFSLVNPGILIPAFFAFGLVRADKDTIKRLVPLLGFSLIYLATYTISGKGYAVNFPWYFAPPLLGVVLPAGARISRAVRGEDRGGRGRRFSVLVLLVVVMVWSLLSYLPVRTGIRVAYKRIVERERVYAAAAFWLRANSPEDSVVAGHEIGIIGFFSERKILDLFGLVSVESWPWGESGTADELRPDYIVMKEYPSLKDIKKNTAHTHAWIRWRDLWIGAGKGLPLPTADQLENLYFR